MMRRESEGWDESRYTLVMYERTGPECRLLMVSVENSECDITGDIWDERAAVQPDELKAGILEGRDTAC